MTNAKPETKTMTKNDAILLRAALKAWSCRARELFPAATACHRPEMVRISEAHFSCQRWCAYVIRGGL